MPEIARKPLPDHDILHEKLRYDAETGLLWFKSKKTKRSQGVDFQAGNIENRGYVSIGFQGRKYLAHRIIWKMLHKVDPSTDIDHINGVRDDNRADNLRLASKQQNRHNSQRQKRNSSGIKGVGWNKAGKKWTARIQCNGVKVFVGYFKTAEEANTALTEVRKKYHLEFSNHG